MAQGPVSRETDPARDDEARAPVSARAAADAATSSNPAAEGTDEAVPEWMLGEFRILRRLGKGGMAEVFLAEQTSLKRNVAVKVLREERLSDPSYLKRFKTEAMAAAALTHPNIIQVYVIGEQDGIHYIAQEYVQGMNLREYLTRKGPPEMGVALHVIRQVASALQAAHAAGIIHRDIKPENIMLTRKGDVKVADFGLAQLTQAGEKVHLTQVGVTMGTPLYMSPEQVNGRKLDQRSDIYSLGVTCYHMLSGAPPFRGETAISVAVQHLKQEPDRLEQIRGDLPPALCRIIHKMMAKTPEKRYASAQDVLRDLRRVTQGEAPGEAALPVETEHPAEHPAETAGDTRLARFATAVWRFPDRPLAGQAWMVVLSSLLAGGAAAGVGWLARERDPFAAPLQASSVIPELDSAAKQYMYAQKLKTSPEAWQAVIDRPSPDRLFQNHARRQLAMLYLTKGRYDEAQVLFEQLSGESEAQWRAFGLAGEAVILQLRGQYQESQRVIERLKPLYEKLDDFRLRSQVNDTIERNSKQLNTELDQEWKERFDKEEREAGQRVSE